MFRVILRSPAGLVNARDLATTLDEARSKVQALAPEQTWAFSRNRHHLTGTTLEGHSASAFQRPRPRP